jgi:hypothetical protein
MEILWHILLQFVFRLSLGVALAMALTPPRWVTAGFYRVHLWVVLGLNTFAALIASSRPADWPPRTGALALAVGVAVAAYGGAVVWLYEKQTAGKAALWLVAALSFIAAVWTTEPHPAAITPSPNVAATAASALAGPTTALNLLDILSSGLLLGATITAMFLGHWYLNHPGMDLKPLRRLVLLMAGAIVLRGAAALLGLGLEASGAEKALAWWLMVSLRWGAGLVLTLLLAGLTWQTLKIPNTQSATGILYAAVILAFIGELTSQLLSADALYPL